MAQATLPRALRAALGDSCRCAQQACHNAAGLWAAAQMPARLRKEADAVVRTLRMAEASARSAAALATMLQPQLGAAPEAPRDQQRQQQNGGAAKKGAKKKGPRDASGARRGKPAAPAVPAPSSARAAAGHASRPEAQICPRASPAGAAADAPRSRALAQKYQTRRWANLQLRCVSRPYLQPRRPWRSTTYGRTV